MIKTSVCVCVCLSYSPAVPVNSHDDEVKPSSNLRMNLLPPSSHHQPRQQRHLVNRRSKSIWILCEGWHDVPALPWALNRKSFQKYILSSVSTGCTDLKFLFRDEAVRMQGCEAGRKNGREKYKRSLRYQQMAVASHHGQQKVLINILCKGSQYLL